MFYNLDSVQFSCFQWGVWIAFLIQFHEFESGWLKVISLLN